MENGSKSFPAASILLEMVKDEYSKERERAVALDNKASFFITLIVAVVTIFVPIIPLSRILGFYRTADCSCKCIVSIELFAIVIAFFLLVVAFRQFYNAYKIANYKRPDIKVVDDTRFLVQPEEIVTRGMCEHYKEIVEFNVEIVADKCDKINSGVMYCGFGFAVLIISTIALIITVGG